MSDYTGPDLCALTACEAVDLLEKGDVAPVELIDAALSRIDAVDPAINAMPTLCPDRARAHSARLDRGDAAPWLAGLPVAIKDLTDVAGVRTTYGTKGFADHVPTASDPLVERLETRGCIVIGKSNTPEMGAGGNTFNDVLGRTRNPWNTDLNAGGSSGGAAAALAAGEVWLAHGSDFGGSLRTPAAYCGIVGLRPSPGRAGGGGKDNVYAGEGVQGPMARTVEDCALFLDALTGFDPRIALSLEAPARSFLSAVREAEPPKRVAFAPDLGGYAPVEPEIAELLAAAMTRFAGAGVDVVEAAPDVDGLANTYDTLRAMNWAAGPGRAPASIRKHYKPALEGNLQRGEALSSAQIYDAIRERSRLFNATQKFLETYEAIACPVIGLAALNAEIEYPTEVGGEPATDYMSWLRFSNLATVTGLPAISVPIGMTKSGAPMGIQLIGRPRGEAALLRTARVMEEVTTGFGMPIDPRAPV